MRLFIDPDCRPSAQECDRRPRALLPAAGLLLRHVRPGRADPQRPRPVRPDDVGADRQQRHLGRDAGDLPRRLRRRRPGRAGGYTAGREALLGIGSTLGIAVQLLILLPFLADGRRASSGRASTSAAPGWGTPCAWASGRCSSSWSTRSPTPWWSGCASSGTAGGGDRRHRHHGLLRRRFLIMMVPHSVVTVSLATAILPALSRRATADGPRRPRRPAVGHAAHRRSSWSSRSPRCCRSIAPALAQVLFGYGAAADYVDNYVPSLALFGAGLVVFTVHYLMLRGFYALEQTPHRLLHPVRGVRHQRRRRRGPGRRDQRQVDVAGAGRRLHRGVPRRRGRSPPSCCGSGSAVSAATAGRRTSASSLVAVLVSTALALGAPAAPARPARPTPSVVDAFFDLVAARRRRGAGLPARRPAASYQ